MDKPTRDFLEQLGRGPAVLLLGQKHLSLDTGEDPLLKQVADKYGLESPNDYDVLLDLGLDEAPDTALAWLDERCQRIPTQDHMEILAEYPWSAVVTSAVDTVWPTAFRVPWREIQPIVDERHTPA